jgi:hypothetical protein
VRHQEAEERHGEHEACNKSTEGVQRLVFSS